MEKPFQTILRQGFLQETSELSETDLAGTTDTALVARGAERSENAAVGSLTLVNRNVEQSQETVARAAWQAANAV